MILFMFYLFAFMSTLINVPMFFVKYPEVIWFDWVVLFCAPIVWFALARQFIKTWPEIKKFIKDQL